MTPFCRVKWTEPDHEKRALAQQRLQDRARSDEARLSRMGTREMQRYIAEFPDIDAVITLHGVLMSEVVYVPGHLARWVCIVATTAGNIEMNPLDLTVTGVWIPGEPLGEVAE